MKHLEKKYVCNYPGCGKKYGLANLFRLHQDKHKNVKNFACPLCSNSYFQRWVAKFHQNRLQILKRNQTTIFLRNYLDRHIKAVHMKIKIDCEIIGCKSSFPRKDSLRFHILNQHKDLDPSFVQTILENIRELKLPKTRDFLKQISSPQLWGLSK